MLQSNHRPLNIGRDASSTTPHPPSIVCGLDGTPASADIARIAGRLAVALRGAVEYVHVLDGAPGSRSGEPLEERRRLTRAMLDSLQDAGEAPGRGRLIEFGDPGRRLAACADEINAEMIVVGSRRDASLIDPELGSVSARLAADGPCPVLIVPPKLQQHVRPAAWRTRTLVCGFDGSAAGWESALRAGRLAARLDCTLKLVSVDSHPRWHLGEVAQDLSTELARPGVLGAGTVAPAIDWEQRGGDPAWELECVAATATAPLIALGSRGLGPHTDPLLGSTARRLLATARRPILITPITAAGPSRRTCSADPMVRSVAVEHDDFSRRERMGRG